MDGKGKAKRSETNRGKEGVRDLGNLPKGVWRESNMAVSFGMLLSVG